MLGIILLLAMAAFALKNNGVQNYIANRVTQQLSQKLNTKVQIGNVDYQYFNTFSFDRFYIEDLHKDTLLFVDKGYTDFNFWDFFNGKFVFNDIKLNRLYGNLVIDKNGVSNLDFVLKAFQKPNQPKKESKLEFNFKNIKIADSRFRFANLRSAPVKNTALFDVNRMSFAHLNMNLNVDYLKKDSLSARINSMSTVERSGLVVKNIETEIRGWKKGLQFPFLNISLPNSALAMDSVSMSYDSIADLKNILNKVKWTAKIKASRFAPKDFSGLVPNLKGMKDYVTLKANVSGRISSFRIQKMELNYGNAMSIKTNLDLNGLPKIDETFIYADIKDLHVNKGSVQDFISQITNKPFVLPKELSRLGVVKYTGNISGFFSNLVAYGNITTDVGSLKTDILVQLENELKDLKYNGTIRSSSFQLGRLLNTKTLGNSAFKINTKGSKLRNKSLQGTISGDIAEIYLNKYNYKNINVDGKYDGTGFEGKMDVNDPNLNASFDGVVDLTQKLPVFNFDLLVKNADIHALQLTKEYKDSRLSFHGNTNMIGNSLDNLNGYLQFDSVRFYNDGKTLAMGQLMFESEVGRKSSKFTITSDLINGNFEGDFKYSTIPQTISSIFQNYIPALSGTNIQRKWRASNAHNYMNIDLTMSDTKLLSEVLKLPFTLDGETTVRGYVDDVNERLELKAQTPFLSFGSRKIQDVSLNLNNLEQKLNLIASAKVSNKNNLINFNVKASAANDSLYTQLGWQNNDTVVYAGELQANTKFKKEHNLSSALVSFLPTQIIVADSTWDVLASQVNINPDTTFRVHNFRIQNKEQYVNLNGLISKSMSDTLSVDMNDLNLDFIMALIKMKDISIKGRATGQANVFAILKKPVFEADILVKKAKFNDSPVGDAYLYSTWDRENQEILASGTFVDNKDTIATANGVYIPKNDSLDFTFDAHKLNLAFLNPFLSSISKDISGLGSGKVRMFGKSKAIGFEGNALAENAKLTVDYLKTTYSFTDSIYLTRKSIAMKNITVYDEEKNQGILNGLITHDGTFKDMKYDLKINAQNMMALNTQSKDNEFFYGKAYASGNVHIHGDEDNTYIDVNATSQPKTKVYISVGGASIANDNDFISFVNQKDTTKTDVPKKQLDIKTTKSTHLRMNLMVDVTPNAEIQLIVDPKGGDMLSGKGSGNLRMEYDDEADMKLYGTYTIDEGYYLFTLQNLIRKRFIINQGSSIAWTGNMLRAQLNIKAIYALTASLRDLMSDAILSSTTRTSVPVNTILELTGNLMQPDIKFDIDLPKSDETLKMQVHNLINTEEMMNRQMMYLLLFSKFYTPDYSRTSLASSTLSNSISFALNTGFGQLNNFISQFSKTISLGANVRNTGIGTTSSQDYEAELSYQPNNRLIVNGNFGYRKDDLAKNKIIGDVDAEYMLTDNGKLRLKAYNHTVDRYTLRSAPFIQGVGLMYKESFNSWDELIRNYWDKIFVRENAKTDTTKITAK